MVADSVLRTITDDGSFRVVAARSDATARDAIAAQGVTGVTAALFGQLVAGVILLRETLSPAHRVQLDVDDRRGRGRLVCDAWPGGDTRGRVMSPDDGSPIEVGGGSRLRVSRPLSGGRLHEGIVAVPEGGGICEGLMAYMQESEQVFSVIAAATFGEEGERRAGGYVVQLLPEYDRAALSLMVARLGAMPPMAQLLGEDATPEGLTARLFLDMASTELEASTTRFACACSRDRVELALSSFARGEIEQALADGRPLEARCEFCRTSYRLERDDLTRLLGASVPPPSTSR